MENTATIPALVTTHVVRGRVSLNVVAVVTASLLIALSAQIAIPLPFTPVPLTLQPLAVLLVGVVLGSGRGAAAAALYLLEGASGLPFFSQGHGGAHWLFGPTGGYLMSYPAAAWLAGWLSERGWGTTMARAVCGMVAALAVIYAGGWSWLAVQAGPRAAFSMGIVPFVIADIVKVALGATLLPQIQKMAGRRAGT
jgi:biotin transport system substrate-specific component